MRRWSVSINFAVHVSVTLALLGFMLLSILLYWLATRFGATGAWLQASSEPTVVLPFGILASAELLTGIVLRWRCPAGVPCGLATVGLALLAAVWISVPYSVRLAVRALKDPQGDVLAMLTVLHRVRMGLWVARGFLVAWMVSCLASARSSKTWHWIGDDSSSLTPPGPAAMLGK